MSLAELIAADNDAVFLNCSDFAEARSVRYDGERYDDVPMTLTRRKQHELVQLASEHTEGLHIADAVAHFSIRQVNGVLPKPGRWIEISDGEALGAAFFRQYRILVSDCEMGMVRLELEAVEE